MTAILADTDGLVLYLVLGCAFGIAYILLLSADVQQDTGNGQEQPQEQVDDPPPPADQQPPQATVAFLVVLGLGPGDALGLLLNLEVNAITSAFGTTDVCHGSILHIFVMPQIVSKERVRLLFYIKSYNSSCCVI